MQNIQEFDQLCNLNTFTHFVTLFLLYQLNKVLTKQSKFNWLFVSVETASDSDIEGYCGWLFCWL